MADEDDSPKMTLRIYTRTAEGDVKNDSGVRPVAVDKDGPIDSSAAFPKCGCPQHRGGHEKGRR